MATSYLNKDGLLYFLQQIRPNATPQMDGTASTGTAKRFANQDHVHPSDTSKADKASTVSTVTWDSTNKKITKTINGTTSDVVTTATLKSAIGDASTSASGLMTTSQVTKLNNVASGAEVNQNAFSNVKVGSTTIAADAKTDTLELVGGTNITLTPDATNDKVTIAFNGTIPTVPNNFGTVKVGSTSIAADTTSDTLELVAGTNIALTPDATNDKVTIETTAEVNQNAFSTIEVMKGGGTSFFNVPAKEKQSTVRLSEGDNITFSGYKDSSGTYYKEIRVSAKDTTYNDATTSEHGLMSTADKTKLNGIAAGAEVNVNADWNASSGDAQILNKPTLGAAAAKGVVTSISSDSANLPTVTAVKNYVATAITGAAAFQGTAPTSFAPTGYKKGYYWVVGTAGSYVGQTCEAGDMIFAVADYASSYKAADFTVVQTNLDITAITNAEIDTIVAS